MKRTLLAGTFYALAGAATLLLVASIFYSCRSGGDPHHERGSHEAPTEETHYSISPTTTPDGPRLTFASSSASVHRSYMWFDASA